MNWKGWEHHIEHILRVRLDEENGIEQLQYAIEGRHKQVTEALALPLSREEFALIEESTQRLKKILLAHQKDLQNRLKKQKRQEQQRLSAYQNYQKLGNQ